jgi:transketolase
MRKQFVKTIEEILEKDKRLILLLGDIGVFGFNNAFKKYPDRVYNIGILEQSMVSMASGLAMTDFIPVLHTIAPFLIERSTEQIKNDFCYQKLGGNFISVGASYDYSALGCTHHCPADVGILKNLPSMEIILPGTAEEFDCLFKKAYSNSNPTYFRLTERNNKKSYDVNFGKAKIIKKGKLATIIAVGTMLDRIIEAAKDIDVTILYYTTLEPFDFKTLKNNAKSKKIILCEPYYSGALTTDIINTFKNDSIELHFIGIAKEFLREYGKAEEHDELLSLSENKIRRKIKNICKIRKN